MSAIVQDVDDILPEYAVDNLGASFKVILVDSARYVYDMDIGEYCISIPDEQGLLHSIAVVRAVHPLKLAGPDIRFLRKSLGFKSKDLAEHLDISPEHLSRCEKGEKVLSPNSEKLLRLLILMRPLQVYEQLLFESTERNEQDLKSFLAYGRAVRELISDMRILAASNGEELVLRFSYEYSSSEHSSGPANDDWPDGEWENPLLPKAAA
jgi:DNA-binding transcriptional regulator YiaG